MHTCHQIYHMKHGCIKNICIMFVITLVLVNVISEIETLYGQKELSIGEPKKNFFHNPKQFPGSQKIFSLLYQINQHLN